jgi:nucleotide-binding universal stress UspA family protein
MSVVVNSQIQPSPGAVDLMKLATGRPTDIVAIATCTSPWNPGVQVATALAARWGCLLTACFVDASLRMLQGPETEPPALELLLDMPVHGKNGVDFRTFAKARGVSQASWVVAHANLARVLPELGAWHGLVVLEADLIEEETMIELLGEVLLACRLPILILPTGWDGSARFSRALVAWDGSTEAIHAIHDALPFLQDARRVVLLDGRRLASSKREGYLPRFEPFVYMLRHGIEADPMYASLPPGDAGAGLLEEAEQVGADLIVMGAFGHSRMRERVLGGTTHHVLKHARIPIFLQH